MNDKFEMRDMTGSIFPTRGETIVGQGPVKLFDEETDCYLIENTWTTSDGQQRTMQKLAIVIGVYSANKQKRNENDSDHYVNGIIGDIPIMCWGREKVSKKGTAYTSLSFKEKDSQPRANDGDIPL